MLPRIIEVAKCLIPVDEVLTLQEKKTSLLYWFPPPIKTDRHDITKILLKVVLKHHKPNQPIY
jgi:hypothetical protein